MTGISDIFLNGIRPVQDTPASNVSGDGISYLSSLKNGDTFSAKVVDVSGLDVTLKLPTGGTVNARLSSDMNITQGQTISFEVKNGGTTVSIAPLLTNTSTDISVLKALGQAQLPVTESTVGMTSEMMKAGLSIDRSSLLNMYENVMNNPEAKVSDIVDLTKLGLSVNEENLSNIENYKNLSYQIDSGLQTLAEKTDQALLDMVKGGDVTGAAKLMTSVIDSSLSFLEDGVKIEDFVKNPDITADEIPNDASEGKIVQQENSASDAAFVRPDNNSIQDNNDQAGNLSVNVKDPLDDSVLTAVKDTLGSTDSGEKADLNGYVSVGVNSSVKQDAALSGKNVQDAASRALELLKNLKTAEQGTGIEDPARKVNADTELKPAVLSLPENFDKAAELYKEITGNKEYVPSDMKDLLTNLSALAKKAIADGDSDTLKKLVTSDPLRKMSLDTLKNLWSISPSEVAEKDKVESLYKRLSTQIGLLKEGLISAGAQNTPALSAANNMSSNIDFLQQINQMYAYIQLPLKLSGGDSAHGDLYVFSNRKNMSSDDSHVTAFLHLDMDHLGPVDVYVSMDVNAGGKVSTNFTVADDETLDLLDKNMHLLTERLQKRGYDLQTSMKVKGEDEDREEDALDKGGVNLLLVHSGNSVSYKSGMRSFDVRA